MILTWTDSEEPFNFVFMGDGGVERKKEIG